MMFALPTSPLMSIRELLLWPKVALLPWCVSEADELLLSVQSRSWAAISAFVSRPLLLRASRTRPVALSFRFSMRPLLLMPSSAELPVSGVIGRMRALDEALRTRRPVM